MTNPYILAAVRANDEHYKHGAKGVNITPAQMSFIQGMEIKNPRNRALVLTARAHEMDREEIIGVINYIQREKEQRLNLLRGLNAPKIILDNQEKMNKDVLAILNRALNKK
jgi:hypothetical protein